MPLLLPLLEHGRLSPAQAAALLDRDPDAVAPLLGELLGIGTGCVQVTDLDRPPDFGPIDVQHYDIEILEVDETTRYLSATTTLTIRALEDLTTIDLDLAEVQVLSVEMAAGGPFQPVSSFHQGAVLRVGSFPTVPAGQEFDVRVHYESTDPGCLAASGIPSGPVFPGQFNSRPEATLHTFSEPIFARYWFPCHDEPWDKATATLSVIVPAGKTASASGEWVSTTQVNGLDKVSWSMPSPISTYLIAFYVGDYVKLEETSPGGVPLEYFTFSDLVAATWFDYANVPDMIDFFSDLWVPYPNSRYAMTLGWFGGGMEHQMNALIGYFFIRGNRSLETLFSHELAHQWWGDLVTMDSWGEIWLNEGFATYAEQLYDEHRYGWDVMRSTTAFIDSVYFARPDSLDHPVSAPRLSRIFSFEVYEKGGRVLDMLRGVSRLRLMTGPPQPPAAFAAAALQGDARFFNIFPEYANAHAWDNATTDDFQAVAEAELGEPLDWFFDPWLKGTGNPGLVYDWVSTTTPNGTYLEAEVRQAQSGTVFEMPLHIRYQAGADTLDEVRELTAETLEWEVLLPPGDWELILDPDDWMMEEHQRFSIIATLRNVGVFPNPSSRGFDFIANLKGEASQPATLVVYDVLGKLVREQDLGMLEPGPISAAWNGIADDGRRAPPGAYFARLRVGNKTSNHRLVVLP